MFILAGTYEVEPSLRDEFIEVRRKLMIQSRAEFGCIDYYYCADPLDAGKVKMFECWESEEAIAGHRQAMAAMSSGDRPTNPGMTKRDVFRYEISSVTVVPPPGAPR